MEVSKEVLSKAAEVGSQEVTKAFKKLSGADVSVKASAAEMVSYDFIGDNVMGGSDSNSIIAYAQIIDGVKGISILAIKREDALALVDLLNRQDVGTTGVLMDIDRSAVKETLNILSNSYLNALSKMTESHIIIAEPYLMTSKSLDRMLESFKKNKVDEGEMALVFRTSLEITKHKIKPHLYMIFDSQIVDIVKNIIK